MSAWGLAHPIGGHIAFWVLVIFFGIVYANLYERAYETLPIRLDNCQPVDIWAKLSRAYDPLEFWVHVHSDLTHTDEDNPPLNGRRSDMMKTCDNVYKNDPNQRMSCFKSAEEHISQVDRKSVV